MATQAVSSLLTGTTLAGFDPAILARLGSLGRMIELPQGSTPIREGTVCDWLGVVITGRFGLRLHLPGGQDRTILSVEAGDVVGWSAVLSPSVATSTAVALLPTTAVVFDGVPLRAALASDCVLAAALYERLLAAVARRLVATRLQLLDLYRPAAEPW